MCVCVWVCVCVCVCDSVCLFMHRSPRCCSPASLLMTQQSTLMTRNTHSLLLCEPQLIIWSVKHRKIVSPPFKNKKEKSVRTQQGMRRNWPIRFHSSGVERRKAPITQISSGLWWAWGGGGKWRGGPLQDEWWNQNLFVYLFTANSSLKPVRGSRSPLIRSSTVFALLLSPLSSGRPTAWAGSRHRETVLIYLISKCILFIPPSLLLCMVHCLLGCNPVNHGAQICLERRLCY